MLQELMISSNTAWRQYSEFKEQITKELVCFGKQLDKSPQSLNSHVHDQKTIEWLRWENEHLRATTNTLQSILTGAIMVMFIAVVKYFNGQ